MLLAGQRGDSHPEHPSKAFKPCCALQLAFLTCKVPKAFAPRRAGDHLAWLVSALFSPKGARRKCCRCVQGRQPGIYITVARRGIFGPSAYLGPSENIFLLAPCAGPFNSTHTSTFQSTLSYSCCPEQDQSDLWVAT